LIIWINMRHQQQQQCLYQLNSINVNNKRLHYMILSNWFVFNQQNDMRFVDIYPNIVWIIQQIHNSISLSIDTDEIWISCRENRRNNRQITIDVSDTTIANTISHRRKWDGGWRNNRNRLPLSHTDSIHVEYSTVDRSWSKASSIISMFQYTLNSKCRRLCYCFKYCTSIAIWFVAWYIKWWHPCKAVHLNIYIVVIRDRSWDRDGIIRDPKSR
jgi:hypothetical protein